MNVEYLQYRAIDLLARTLPRRAAYAVSDRVSDIQFSQSTQVKAAVKSNLRHIHAFKGEHLTEERLEQLARAVFRGFGRYIIDFFHFTRISWSGIGHLLTIEGLPHLDAALALGKGAFALTAHFGSWELCGAMCTALRYPVNLVVLPMQDPKTDELFESRRQRRCANVIPVGHAVRSVVTALARNEIVGVMGDIDYTPHTELVDFMGKPARLPSGTARLCKRTGAPIVPGFVLRRPDDSYLARIYPPITPDEGTTREEIQSRIIRVLEEIVLLDPSQWFVFHDFWDIDASLSVARDQGAR